MVDYVMEKYGNKWLLDDDISDEILDDLLKRKFEKQQRLKEERIDNVEVVLNKPKKAEGNMIVLKGKPGLRSKSVGVLNHSNSKEDKLRSSYKTVEADVGLNAVSLTDVVEAKKLSLVKNCILGHAYVKTWQQIMQKEYGIKKEMEMLEQLKMLTGKAKGRWFSVSLCLWTLCL
uniref:Uncharacterized protein n=1 Tax=Tanacetum cinerariifolium TaxID=118510 RepID=A0A699J4R5_TANCI|nr:hypothetical protein [Tanacetum cinerariifolium]